MEGEKCRRAISEHYKGGSVPLLELLEFSNERALERRVVYKGGGGKNVRRYGSTGFEVIRNVLLRLGLQRRDVVYDLGSGYGRFVVYAAAVTEAVVKGVEIVPERAAFSLRLLNELMLTNASVEVKDIRETDIGDGNVFFINCLHGGEFITAVGNKLSEVAKRREVRVVAVGVAAQKEMSGLDGFECVEKGVIFKIFRTHKAADNVLGFWKETFDEVDVKGVDCTETTDVDRGTQFRAKQLTFTGLGEKRFNCLCVEPHSDHVRKVAVIFIPGGYAGWKPRPYLWYEGVTGFFVDPRGQGHSKMDCDVRDSLTTGVQNRYKHHLRFVYADVRQAINFLSQQGYESIGVAGTCFGGSIALGIAALDKRIKVVAAEMPYLADWKNCCDKGVKAYEALVKHLEKYPDTEEKVFGVLQNFDLLNLVGEITVPTIVTIGGKNDVVPSSLVHRIYDAIGGGVKVLLTDSERGYGNDPNFPYWAMTLFRKYL